MLNQTIDYITNPIYFNIILFFILFAISFGFSKVIGLKSFKSVIAIHLLILFTFVIIEVIDYLFILFAIIELVILLKMNGSVENEID